MRRGQNRIGPLWRCDKVFQAFGGHHICIHAKTLGINNRNRHYFKGSKIAPESEHIHDRFGFGETVLSNQ